MKMSPQHTHWNRAIVEEGYWPWGDISVSSDGILTTFIRNIILSKRLEDFPKIARLQLKLNHSFIS